MKKLFCYISIVTLFASSAFAQVAVTKTAIPVAASQHTNVTAVAPIASILSDEEKSKVKSVASLIIRMIENDGWATSNSYFIIVDLLQQYQEKFAQENLHFKKAMATMLLNEIVGNYEDTIPAWCSIWFDGCNDCQVWEDWTLACTKKACFQQEEPMCRTYEKTLIVWDHTVECMWAWPMTCMLVKEQWEEEYSYFYSRIEWFEYEEWYKYTLLVTEEYLDPSLVPADASSIKWTLEKVIDIDAQVPNGCTFRFDGCNNCNIGENWEMACTRKACFEAEKPYCLD